jgi:hypothetical protein
LKTPQMNSIFSRKVIVSVLFQPCVSRRTLSWILIIRSKTFGLFIWEDDSPPPGIKGLAERPPVGTPDCSCLRWPAVSDSGVGSDLLSSLPVLLLLEGAWARARFSDVTNPTKLYAGCSGKRFQTSTGIRSKRRVEKLSHRPST